MFGRFVVRFQEGTYILMQFTGLKDKNGTRFMAEIIVLDAVG